MNESKDLAEFEKTLLYFFSDNLLYCRKKYRACTNRKDRISFVKEMQARDTTIYKIIQKHQKLYEDGLVDFMLQIMSEGDKK